MAQKINGFGVDELVTKLTGLTSTREAYEILGDYFNQKAIGISRSFNYGKLFAPDAPGCVPKFTRSFNHTDWKDGQDLVQAEQSAGEDGFNFRFHRIESDLDALSVDVKTAFSCMKTMRQELSDRLTEIRNELNRINVELQDCCTERVVLRPDTEIVAGGKYLGKTQWFGGKMVNAYETAGGIVLLPDLEPVGGGGDDPRVKRTIALAKILDQDKKLQKVLSGDAVTKERILKEFGDLESDEFTLRELLEILPAGGKFSSPDSLLKAVADREAGSIRAGGMTDELVGNVFGGQEVKRSAEVSVQSFELVPVERRSGLVEAGVNTVGDLAGLSTAELTEKLKGVGVELSPGEAAAWTAGAQVMTLVR